MEEIKFLQWLFEGRLRQGKNVLPDGLNWLCYFAGSSKSHCENSSSFIFLESPHQVNMKNVVKCSIHSFGYFNTLETHSEKCLTSVLFSKKESHIHTSFTWHPLPKIIENSMSVLIIVLINCSSIPF